MLVTIFGFFLGITASLYATSLPIPQWGGALFAFGLFLLLRRQLALAKAAAGFCFGLGWFILYSHLFAAWTLPLAATESLVTGQIASLPESRGFSTRFNFTTERLCPPTGCENKTILLRLSWYGKHPSLRVGQRWQLKVFLKRPHAFADPGSANYSASLAYKGIQWVGSVRKSSQNQYLGNEGRVHLFAKLRQELVGAINHALRSSPFAGIIIALCVGVTQGIPAPQWQVFRETGTSHLVAISGLHISLIAMLIYHLTHFLWRRLWRAPLYWPAPVVGALAALGAALLYSLISGFSIPTQRAFIMIALFMSAKIFNQSVLNGRGLWIALGLVIAVNPYSVLAPGFWLSFGAVAVIAFSMMGYLPNASKKWQWLRLQWAATLGLTPLCLYLFQQASLVGSIANFVAIPWVSFIVVPGSLLGCALHFISPTIATIIWTLSNRSLEILWLFLAKMATVPFSSIHYAISEVWILIAALIAVLLHLAPRGFPGKLLSTIFVLPIIFFSPAKPDINSAKLTVLDVGQGLASIVQTHNHLLIFDTGDRFGPDSDAGSAVVVPYLRMIQQQKIDGVVVSHGDSDHRGGFVSIEKNFEIRQLYTSVPEFFPKRAAILCEAGYSWIWDGVKFQFLHPSADFYGLNNDSSCVLQVVVGEHVIILPGDIEAKAEKHLVSVNRENLAASILIAAHHGSRTSSTEAFIQAVDPRYVLFPVGYLNRYRFPHPRIIERYQQQGVRMFDTANSGAIEFTLTPGQPISPPTEYRRSHAHWWDRD